MPNLSPEVARRILSPPSCYCFRRSSISLTSWLEKVKEFLRCAKRHGGFVLGPFGEDAAGVVLVRAAEIRRGLQDEARRENWPGNEDCFLDGESGRGEPGVKFRRAQRPVP